MAEFKGACGNHLGRNRNFCPPFWGYFGKAILARLRPDYGRPRSCRLSQAGG